MLQPFSVISVSGLFLFIVIFVYSSDWVVLGGAMLAGSVLLIP